MNNPNNAWGRNSPPPPPPLKRLLAPPPGKNRVLSLAMLLASILLLALGTFLAAGGANGQQAVLEKGRLWFALWIIGQAASLCVCLLFLLPLDKDMRRPALFTMIGASLLFNLCGELTAVLSQFSDYSRGTMIFMILFISVFVLAFSPSLWLLLGLARRKTSEKMAGLMGCGYILIGLLGLISRLSGSGSSWPPAYLAALDLIQGACFVILLLTWPVLDRPVLAKAAAESDEPEGDIINEQPEQPE